MYDRNLTSKSQNAVTRKTGSLNLARLASVAAAKASFPALTGRLPRKHQASTIPNPAGIHQAEEDESLPFSGSFCITGTAMNPKPRQVSPLFLTGKARSYISSSNAEDSDVNKDNCKEAGKKRRRRRRKQSKSAKNTEDERGDGNVGVGTQKVVKMLQDGSLLLCRVPILNSTSVTPRCLKKSRSRSRSRSNSRPSKSPISQATRMQHQLAKSVVCFAVKTPHEPICFTVKRENHSRRSPAPSYYYHDENMCNQCCMLKRKRELRASLRAPKYKNFGVQTDIKVVPIAEKPCPQLNPMPTKAIITKQPVSPRADEASAKPPHSTSNNKNTGSKFGHHELAGGLGPKLVTTNPTVTPGSGNQSAARQHIKTALLRNSLSKEIVTKSRLQRDVPLNNENIMRLRNVGNRSFFFVEKKTDFRNMAPLGGVCKVSA